MIVLAQILAGKDKSVVTNAAALMEDDLGIVLVLRRADLRDEGMDTILGNGEAEPQKKRGE